MRETREKKHTTILIQVRTWIEHIYIYTLYT